MMHERTIDYKLFFDRSPDLFCIAGFDGYFKKVNPAVVDLLGYTEEELYSRPVNDFVYEDDRDITTRARNRLTESIPLYNFENRYQAKNGDTVWLAWTSFPLESEKLVFAIAKDVSHKKRLEAERLSLLEELAKTNKEFKKFALTTSHDLRSPLNGLLSVFELLDVTKVNDRESRELLELLKLTGENLKERLNNYVDILSDKLGEPTRLESVDLKSMLNKVLQSIHSLLQTSGAEIRADFSATRTVLFNDAYMESVYLNMITNAIKYSKPNTPPVVDIRSDIRDGIKCLTIADNGMGFNMAEAKNKIFGLHQTFHNHRDSKGVGLYLVHKHITSLGGNIEVDSRVGEGTRFEIFFPQANP